MNQRYVMMLPNLQPDELALLDNLTQNLNEEQSQMFITMYASRRKTTETVLICTLIAFLGVAGIQRFILGQVGMGILYLFTGGLCLIGTIMDIVNHKRLTFEFNAQQAHEVRAMIR